MSGLVRGRARCYLGPVLLPRRVWLFCVSMLPPAACGDPSPPVGADESTSSGTSGASAAAEASTVELPTSTEPATGDPTRGSTGPSTSSTASDGSTTTGGDSETGGRDANGCPLDAPRTWVGCESFDDIDDPPSQLPEWLVFGDAFGVEPAAGDPEDRALRITLTPGLMFGGWVTLRFGDGPDGPGVDSPDQSFDEIWVRYFLRTGEDWPGYAVGDIGEVIAMNGPDWAIATEVAIRGDASQRLHPLGWTCIFDGVLACNGRNDWSGGLQLIWEQQGQSVLFDAAHAGQWQCVEAHVRLDAPGAADGRAQVWVDGVEEITVEGVGFRGTWTDYGINALRFTNYATPPSRPLDFWVDDVVAATERVGCER
jgi:hypothetical protein